MEKGKRQASKSEASEMDDPLTAEWLEALDCIIDEVGPDRTEYLLAVLLHRAAQMGVGAHHLDDFAFRAVSTIGKPLSQTYDSAVDHAVALATQVIGDQDEAMRWLGTPVRGLDFATPISLLGTKDGAERVETILSQMEHGVW